jgi:dihydrofolate synthase/folylpolyglutamate synthase
MNLKQWLEYQQNLHSKDIDLGLERIAKVYDALFSNGVDFKVITIAGTNGKGSTGNFLAHIFNAANINYGWFSSPHIDKYNERFIINNTQATDEEITTAFEKIEKARKNISLSYFEFSTLAAILIFQAKNIAVAILEIGLGGRLDSVNIVPNNASIITSIGLDHTDFLGDTIEKIAFEKAGIINKNSQLFIPPNLPNVVLDVANTQNTTINIIDKYQKPLKMLGDWQKYNANLAKQAAQYLFDIDEKIIDNALQNTTFTARAEIITYQNKTLIFDTAHNPQAVQNLASIIPAGSIAIFAALKDKDIQAMIDAISSKIDMWYLLQLDDTRSIDVQDLQQQFKNKHTILMDSPTLSLQDALQQPQDTIVIFGSFLTIQMMKTTLS